MVGHAVSDFGLDVGVGEENGAALSLARIDLERERGDLAAATEVPRPRAGVAVDRQQGAKQALGLGFDGSGGEVHQRRGTSG